MGSSDLGAESTALRGEGAQGLYRHLEGGAGGGIVAPGQKLAGDRRPQGQAGSQRETGHWRELETSLPFACEVSEVQWLSRMHTPTALRHVSLPGATGDRVTEQLPRFPSRRAEGPRTWSFTAQSVPGGIRHL